jgi:hypothetical protein
MPLYSHFVIFYNPETGEFEQDHELALKHFPDGLIYDGSSKTWVDHCDYPEDAIACKACETMLTLFNKVLKDPSP